MVLAFLSIMPPVFSFILPVTVSNYFKQTNIQITILTTLARRDVLAYGTIGEVGVKLQVFSGASHQEARCHTNIMSCSHQVNM